MSKPRYAQVLLEATSWYHYYSRCVRRAFVLDLWPYAIMSNHYHVVLHVNKPQADAWGMDEIINRGHMLYKGNVLSQRYIGTGGKGEPLDKIDTNKIQYTVRDYPPGFHKYAKSAAISTSCAADQNAYWKMRDELFASKGMINETLFTELAEKPGLEMNDFSKCMAEDIRAKKVESDLAYGQSLGIQGTPSFFVGRVENGKLVNAQRIVGAQSYSKFAQVVDKLIKKPLM
ncbi:Transposase and inactivated derivatives [hydrothermal vent metagenome]|uniref:Transposase and inactivated derivatives n=1 Tax=hydrothermal vent metagenome TaxID=652676 RepID=A0A3B0WYD2_9ZZZZ